MPSVVHEIKTSNFERKKFQFKFFLAYLTPEIPMRSLKNVS